MLKDTIDFYSLLELCNIGTTFVISNRENISFNYARQPFHVLLSNYLFKISCLNTDMNSLKLNRNARISLNTNVPTPTTAQVSTTSVCILYYLVFVLLFIVM